MNLRFLTITVCYTILIIYASLYPFTDLRCPVEETFGWLSFKFPSQVSKSDIFVNFLAYIPIGYFSIGVFSKSSKIVGSFFISCTLGIFLSFTMESLQAFIPARVSSVSDFTINSCGTVFGAVISVLFEQNLSRLSMIRELRSEYILAGRRSEMGIAVIACWGLSQLAPFAPSLDIGSIKTALKPIWYTLHDHNRFIVADYATYMLYTAGLGIIAQLSAARKNRLFLIFAALSLAVVWAKIFFWGRQLSLEAVSGVAVGIAISALFLCAQKKVAIICSMTMVLAGFTVHELKTGIPEGVAKDFNWIPFRGQFSYELNGIGTILEGIFPFAALSHLSLYSQNRSLKVLKVFGVAFIFLFVFLLEWNQLSIPGRYADITPVLLAVIGWGIPFLFSQRSP